MSKDIWVYAETNNGELCDIVPELLTKGRQLKAHSGGNLTAVVLGSADEHVIGQLSKYGADKIIIGENAALADYSARTYAHAMTELARKYAPEIFIIPATGIGREIAPLTMQALDTGLTADAIACRLCTFTGTICTFHNLNAVFTDFLRSFRGNGLF